MSWDEIDDFLKDCDFPDFDCDGKVDFLDYLAYTDYLDEIDKESNPGYNDDDDEDDEDDNDDSDDHDTHIAGLSFRIANQTESHKNNGIWKYFSELMEIWHYDQALIEHFPELAEDYEPNVSDCTLPNIIIETFEIDQERAVKYLKWLWKTFTPDLFGPEGEYHLGNETESYKGRGMLIERLLIRFGQSEYLYQVLKSDPDFLTAAFKDCVHPKHEYGLAKDYMMLMIRNNDIPAAKLVYHCYLEGQKGRYSDNDLGKLWYDLVSEISWLDLDDDYKIEVTNAVIPLIEAIGVRGEKPLAAIAEYQKEWADDDEYDDDDSDDEEDTEDDSSNDEYAWRKTVAPSSTRFADPYAYETFKEYQNAVNLAYAKYEADKANARRAGYTESNIFAFCKIDILSSTGMPLYYLTGGLKLSVGDMVTVPLGKENNPVDGIVVSIGECYASVFPFDIKQIKTVIGKRNNRC